MDGMDGMNAGDEWIELVGWVGCVDGFGGWKDRQTDRQINRTREKSY